jgi:hypothetical protein
MADPDREQLKRACADALEALTRDQRLDGLSELADSLRALGPPYRFHGELMHGALRDGQDNANTWHLIHMLEDAGEGDVETRGPRRGS